MRVAVHTRHPEHPEQHVYELVAAHKLPRVDLSRSLRSVFCDSSNISRLRNPGSNGVRDVSFLRKMAGVLAAGYLTGVLLSIIMPWTSAEYGRPIALIATVLALPSFVVGFRPMRYDIVVFLIKTYDFWYFVSVNTVSCVLPALYFGDVRAIVILMSWMGNLNSALVDANARMTRHLIIASIIGMVVNSVLIVCVQFRLIQAARHFTLFEYGGRALSVEDVIVNGLTTHMLLLLRNVYRCTRNLANELQQSTSSAISLVHCVNYQCTMKLQLIRERAPSSRTFNGSSRVRLLKSRSRGVNSEKNSSHATTQLTFVKEKSTFNAKNTHVPVQVSNTPWSFSKRLMLRWTILTGILLPIAGASDACTLDQRRWVFYVASTCTYAFCALTWGSSQRQLYQKIVFTFDYFFLSFQLTSLHACACDMVSWDASYLGVANSWLWMHFVISSDALTPVVRAKIGFSTKLLALPVVLFAFVQVIIWYRLIVEGNTNFRDRELFEVFVGRHRIEFRVVPFFFGRLTTMFLWSFRLLWRILRTQGNETLLLRGKVAYACASQHRAAIVPTAVEALAGLAFLIHRVQIRMRVAVHSSLGPHEQPISYVYELVAAHELPQVDLSKSLRSVFCGSSGSRPSGRRSSSSYHRERPASYLRKPAGILAAGYMAGLILCILVPWLSREYGQPIATLATALTVPSVLVSFRPMRYDIMLVLVKTYDFWYLESINTLSCILLALYFDDMRAIAMLVPWVGNLSSALVDANARAIRHLLVASIVGAIVNCAMLVCVQLRLVDATKHFTIFEYGGRVLSVEDVVVNGLATHLLLLLRNVYRRTQFLAHQRLNNWSASLVHCINHRCATKLQLVPQGALPLSRSPAGGPGRTKMPASQPPLGVEARSPRTQMTYVKADFTFDAKNTFAPTEINDTAWPVWKRVVLRCVALLGILLPIAGALEVWTLSQRRWIFYVAFTCTQLFCSLAWAFSQRQLFWKIVFSFDYFFVSFQLSSLHVCACDMVSWNASCFGIVSSCFWMHFVLTADALTPVVRRKIGFRARFLVLPVVLFVYFQASIWFRLVVEGGSDLRDRELFEVLVGNHRIEFRVIPFFFSRLATTLVWSLRLVWRIFGIQGDETLLLRGIVAYEHASPSNAAAIFPEATTSEEPRTH